jgi:CRP-like cAMP-binding protein
MSDTIHFKPGEIIFLEGERSNHLYILEEGEVEVLKNHQVIRVMSEKRSFFGDMAYFLNDRRSATLRARTSVQVVRIDFKDKKNFDESLTKISLTLMETMASRLDDITKKISEMNEYKAFSDKIRHRADDVPQVQQLIEEVEAEIEMENAKGNRELLHEYIFSPRVMKHLEDALLKILGSHLKEEFSLGQPEAWSPGAPPLGAIAMVTFSGERKGALVLDIDENLAYALEKSGGIKEEDLGHLCLNIMVELSDSSSHFKVQMDSPRIVNDTKELEDILLDGRAMQIPVSSNSGKLRLTYQLS